MNLQTSLIKEQQLSDRLTACQQVAVAYSGGVDSTYLTDIAHETLGACA